jgi:spore coat protein U-like protein
MKSTVMRTLIAGILVCLSATGPATAACGTSVTVTATKMAFGKIDPLTLPADTTANLKLKFDNTGPACTNSMVVVTLGVGTGPGATATVRKMTSGSDTLNYTVYTPPGPPGTVWDNAIGYTTPAITLKSNKTTNETITMYGRVLSGQSNAAVGKYTDSLMITVTF